MEKIYEGLIFQWADGKSYHLNIDTEDLLSYIITMGSGRRLEELKKYIELEREGGERLKWVNGFYKGIKIFAFTSGMGPSSAAIAYTEVFKKLFDGIKHAYILRIGTAGALKKGIRKYSIVVARSAVRSEHVSRYIIYPEYPADMDPVIYLTALGTAMDMGYRYNQDLFLGCVETKDDLYFQEGFHNSPIGEGLSERYSAFRRLGVVATEMEVSLLPILRDYFKGFNMNTETEFRAYVGGIFLVIGGPMDREELAGEEEKLIKLGLETMNNVDRFLRGEYNLENILRFISG